MGRLEGTEGSKLIEKVKTTGLAGGLLSPNKGLKLPTPEMCVEP